MVNNAKDYTKYARKPSFVSQKFFNKNYVSVHEIKPVLTLDKPIYVGFSFLGNILCMTIMLLFTDTDSLVYEIKPEKDVYEDFDKDEYLSDFSNYPKIHNL